MILFVDTSALVKIYISEPGSERIHQAIAQGEQVAASDLAFAELHAAFARRRREGLLLASEFEQLRLRLEAEWQNLMQVAIGSVVLALVPGLCERNPLRGADALHLASALLLQEGGLEVTFACSDRTLLKAAAAEGLAVFDPVQTD